MDSSDSKDLQKRAAERIQAWRIAAEHRVETQSSVLVYGRRGGRPIVLKVIRRGGDEWRSGEIAAAFEGKGVVRVFEHVPGALLLEHLRPGTSLVELASRGADEQATDILAAVIREMSPRAPPSAVPAVETGFQEFERYVASRRAEIPRGLLVEAQREYARLCASQSRPRLLHGDLHHSNILFDAERGWLAIDPKGVVGELEYELGAALRNPLESPDSFILPGTIERRVERYARGLDLDAARILAWAFAQAVLAAIREAEDGFPVGPDDPWITLAGAIQRMRKA